MEDRKPRRSKYAPQFDRVREMNTGEALRFTCESPRRAYLLRNAVATAYRNVRTRIEDSRVYVYALRRPVARSVK